MNRRTMLQVCAGVLVAGASLKVSGQVPGYKICAKEGHQKGSKTYTTDYPVAGAPLCSKRLHSTKCPRRNSDWTFKVERVGVCPPEEGKDDKEDC